LLRDGKASESVAIPMGNPSLLVTVVIPGANPQQPSLRMGGQNVATHVVGYDPVSRLGFLQAQGAGIPKSVEWLDDAGGRIGTELRAMTPSGPVKCLTTGWVKQVGGKILPFALLRIQFDHLVPPPGTPLLDSRSRVVALVFQSTGTGSSACAIPAEAVHRVRRDVSNGGNLIRGWLGLTLHAESQLPRIVRVLPDSPAANAGILPADVLVGVGSRSISEYADAANAFFYLVPGQATAVKILRGTQAHEFNITPTSPHAE
jgi:S1-C subfamily serine protease